MMKWFTLLGILGFALLTSGCNGANQPHSQAKQYETMTPPVQEGTMVSNPCNPDIAALHERIDQLERNLIDMRMDYISRINSLEVDVADIKENRTVIKKHIGKKARERAREVKHGKRIPLPPPVISEMDEGSGMSAPPSKTIVTNPEAIQSAYERAIQFYRNGQYGSALQSLDTIVVGEMKKSMQDNVFFWKGMCHFQLNHLEKAISHFNTVVENYPKENKFYEAKMMIATTHGIMGNKSLAINELKRLLEDSIPSEVREKAERAIREFEK